ncbi:hypothetical protein A0J61_03841 [Choanephora cucurbitarum]|uniref:NF-kappa-B inhibitor-like protein 1 n=1 Tax=Choanephora cucurbitarum TaxID=101091 RepID=A0A1C7NGL0_9FUNG|nr:hypothetical protein A0J61_03841 [Choanephora cucurbitarum]
MPKLRFKENERKKKTKHSGRRHREKYYEPPRLYEEETGWAPPSSASKYDQDQAWRERLFEAMMDDEGQDPFYTQYTQPTPRMSDEEHRQYIVDGMYRRKHADEIAEEERRKAERAKRKAEKERVRQEQERNDRLYRQLLEQTTDKTRFIDRWKRLEHLEIVHKKDIPWPISGKSFSLEAVRQFLIDPSASEADNKKKVRKEQARYHPDKFVTRYMRRFQGSDRERERVMAHINEISGFLNELWSQM